ncbi:MAG: HIT family protein [Methanoregula sp.]|nr:HIT family protein [Methanoregula sp.]
MTKKNSPGGYNIGFNVGEVAGQTVMHCHCHVIPRYVGDVVDPCRGLRGVVLLPCKRVY